MTHFIDALTKTFDFQGRTTRTGYWMFILVYVIVYFGLAFLVGGSDDSLTAADVFSLLLLVTSISVTARRLHDIGRSGWWQLISFIPLVGWLVLIYFMVQPSEGDNRFGPAP
ncbi:MAG: DUF805 domain-containing protein [Pseudomonadota bacterium]